MDFLAELLIRLFSKTPKFFTYIKYVSIVIALVTGLPTLLANAGIDLPEAWDAVANKIVSIAAIVSAFIAQLTVPSDVKAHEGLKD